MLKVKGLSVNIGGKEVLRNVSLDIPEGEVMVLFGPNGSGKSSLIKAIMGFGGYDVTGGDISFKGKRLNGLEIHERVALGIGIMYQHPPEIRGVKLRQVAGLLDKGGKKIDDLAGRLVMKDHLDRDINLGFSGGERKRSEMYQLYLQDSDLILLDEPESGVDIENIYLMGKVLNEYLSRPGKSALIITHTGYILDHVKAGKGCLMMDGELWCYGHAPKEMFEDIKINGYEKCRTCHGNK